MLLGSHGGAWLQPADVKAEYANASILKAGRVVFNIKGNDYRLVTAMSYKSQIERSARSMSDRKMNIKPIRTDADYKAALNEVSALMEGDRLDVLVTLAQAYEAQHCPIDPPDPIEAIEFRMAQSGMGVKDLVPYIGPAESRVRSACT